MKKLITLLLVLTMVLSMTACAGNNDVGNNGNNGTNGGNENNKEEVKVDEVGSSLEVLEKIWEKYPEDMRFPVNGGNTEYHMEQMDKDPNYVPANAPLRYDMAYAENLPYVLYVPAESLGNFDEAATMNNAMMPNNFTAGVLHIAEGTDVDAVAAQVQASLASTMWVCGTPDQMLVAVVGGEYLLVAFGINDFMDPFVSAMKEVYPNTNVVYNDSIIV